MAALITKDLGVPVEVAPGGRGEFTVWVGDTRVAQKDSHGFPDDEKVVEAVRQKIAGTR